MTTRPPVVRRRPNLISAMLVSLAAGRLPGKERQRYREEFRAELCVVPTLRQIGVGATYFVAAGLLKRAVRESAASWPAYLEPRPLDSMSGIGRAESGFTTSR